MQVGIWIRVSTEDQARGESPQNHRHRAEQYAAFMKWEIVEVYDLSGVSGKAVLQHPEAVRMLDDVRSGKIKALIFSKLARLARNVRELLSIADSFKECQADLVSLEEKIDTSSAAGRLLFTMIGALAEWERDEISSRVAASVPIRASQGKPIGGLGPYGFKWVDKQLVQNPDEAPVARRACEIFRETKKFMTTAARLNQEGYKARRGPWTDTTIKRMLMNPALKGERVANYSKSKGNGKSWSKKPENEWIRTQVEPIIDKETWEMVQAILAEQGRKYRRKAPIGRYLFSGLLACECGSKERMYVMPYKSMKIPRYVCRTCRNKVNENEVLDQFQIGLHEMILRPEQLEGADRNGKERQEILKRLGVLKKAVAKTTRNTDKLFELYSSETIGRKTFGERHTALQKHKELLEDEIQRIQTQLNIAEIQETGRDWLLQQAKTFVAMWDLFSAEERVRIVKELLAGVTVGLKSMRLAFHYLPEFIPVDKDQRINRGSSPQQA